jgi:Domain of unknown function (DUF4326)
MPGVDLTTEKATPEATGRAMPRRVQLRRTKDWRKPEGAIVVSRPSRRGNRYRIGNPDVPDATTAVRLYEQWLRTLPPEESATLLAPLRGKDLACWCPLTELCHAATLLRLANT